MSNILFTALIIALLYYFFYYLPHQKQLVSNPNPTTKLTQSQFTQTDPILSTELQEAKSQIHSLATELKTNREDYQTKLAQKDNEITNLQKEVRELAKRPLKPTNSKQTQTDSDLENTLDNLIKDIQELNNSL